MQGRLFSSWTMGTFEEFKEDSLRLDEELESSRLSGNPFSSGDFQEIIEALERCCLVLLGKIKMRKRVPCRHSLSLLCEMVGDFA